MDRFEQVGLGQWGVGELVGHSARPLAAVVEHLDAAVGRDRPLRLAGAGDHHLTSRGVPPGTGALARRGREVAQALGADPMGRLRELAGAAVDRLRAVDEDAVVLIPIGMVTVEDYLPTAVAELSVHTCEVAAVIGAQADVRRPVAEVAFAVLGEVAAAQSAAAGPLLALAGRGVWPQGRTMTWCRHWAY